MRCSNIHCYSSSSIHILLSPNFMCSWKKITEPILCSSYTNGYVGSSTKLYHPTSDQISKENWLLFSQEPSTVNSFSPRDECDYKAFPLYAKILIDLILCQYFASSHSSSWEQWSYHVWKTLFHSDPLYLLAVTTFSPFPTKLPKPWNIGCIIEISDIWLNTLQMLIFFIFASCEFLHCSLLTLQNFSDETWELNKIKFYKYKLYRNINLMISFITCPFNRVIVIDTISGLMCSPKMVSWPYL